MGPLYKYGYFTYVELLQIAALLGFFFGVLLERAGFGNPKKLVSIFYLKDFSVLKVMFTAVITSTVGIHLMASLGVLDLSRLYILPTYIWPYVVSGILIGVGFVMGGYCPSTSIVGAASGRLDGLLFMSGMTIGSFLFAELYPILSGFYMMGDMGQVTLEKVLGMPRGVVVFLVCLLGIIFFAIAGRLEDRFGDQEAVFNLSKKARIWLVALLLIAGLVSIGLEPRGSVHAPAQEKPVIEEKVSKEVPRPSVEKEPEFKIVSDEGC